MGAPLSITPLVVVPENKVTARLVLVIASIRRNGAGVGFIYKCILSESGNWCWWEQVKLFSTTLKYKVKFSLLQLS